MDHPPGTILIVSGELSRYTAFGQSLVATYMPDGSAIVWVAGMDVVANLNEGLLNRTGEWVWLMGDDHVFGGDLLARLLDHQVDVVSPMCLMRKRPYRPLAFRHVLDNLLEIERIPMEASPSHGLHRVPACSGAGLLVRGHVFEKLTPPYFVQGQRDAGQMNEDLSFMQKIRQAGFSIYLDCDTVLGHQTSAVIWPVKTRQGGWQAVIDTECVVPQSSVAPCL